MIAKVENMRTWGERQSKWKIMSTQWEKDSSSARS